MSRRWLEGEQRWSCRMKLPETASENNIPIPNTAPKISAAVTMDEASEIAVRRRNGDMSTAIQTISNLDDEVDNLELPSDPDAQATVTDFLDFTEYLPSDMMRSLTLIKNLDQTYLESSSGVHELTVKYGSLPLQGNNRASSAENLRAKISQSLSEAVNVRTLAYAEADRMAEHVDRHYNRAQNILAKLLTMKESYPDSREASPEAQRPGSPRAVRTPKITLRLDGARDPTADQAAIRVPKHRPPRITVPGEVLAPYEFDYGSAGSYSDESTSEDEPLTPRYTPARTLGGTVGKIRLKIHKTQRLKIQKAPRTPRPPGVMGTNVHSSVAGISTSNALAQLEPPPEDAVLGSDDAPWLRLTEWELAKLRKRMKKNAIWNPSDTMIARELKMLGRGIEAYRAEKNKAEATGQNFDPTLPAPVDDGSGKPVVAVGAISIDALEGADVQLSNRGMKLNEAKKLKRENQIKELAKQAAEEAEKSARKMAEAASAMRNLFGKPGAANASESPTKQHSKTPVRKRKRESTADTTDDTRDTIRTESESSRPAIKPQQKRSKVETPIPAPRSSAGSQGSALPIALVHTACDESLATIDPVANTIDQSTNTITTVTKTTIIPLRVSSPKKSSTPILPPSKDLKPRKTTSTPATTTRRRTSAAATPTPTPAPELLPPRRGFSRSASRPASRGHDASVEPSATGGKDRPRRTSTTHNTPAPEVHPTRATSKRARRPAPGPVTASSEGSTAVSVGKRSAAPRKKAGPKKQPKDEEKDTIENWDEVDDEGNVIDPEEPRYCSCNRVSFGVMIACENGDSCEKEWFHLECVDLPAIPPRTSKWYCPDCRVVLGIGEKGEVTARGKKK